MRRFAKQLVMLIVLALFFCLALASTSFIHDLTVTANQIEVELKLLRSEFAALQQQPSEAEKGVSVTPAPSAEPDPLNVDAAFLASMTAGLNARWATSDATDTTTLPTQEYIEYMSGFVEIELNALDGFRTAEFEDPRLGELAVGYISALDRQLDALTYYGTDTETYNQLWDEGYYARCKGIYYIHQAYGLAVDNKDTLSSFLATGRTYIKRDKIIDSFESTLSSMEFEIEKQGEYATYSCVLSNDYTAKLEHVSIQALLIDEDGVQVDSNYPFMVDGWESGAKVRGEMMSRAGFSDIEYVINISTDGDSFEFRVLVPNIGPQAATSQIAQATDIKSRFEIAQLVSGWEMRASLGKALYVPTLKFDLVNHTAQPVSSLEVLVTFNDAEKKQVWSDEMVYVINSLDSSLQPEFSKKVFVYSSVGYESIVPSTKLPALTADVYVNGELYDTFKVERIGR